MSSPRTSRPARSNGSGSATTSLPPPRSVYTSPAVPRACPISLRESAPDVCGIDPPFSGRTARLPWGEVYIFGPSKMRWQRRITSVLLRDAQFAHGEFSSRTLADRAFRRVKSTPSKGKDRDRMGEAKRRRQRPAERTETVIELDEQTNEERRVETIVRDGGSVAPFLKKGLNGVPCNGCRMCCYHPRIEVEPQDDIRHLDIETREDGGQTLRRREDGSCVHLGPEGCTVYAHRPRGCRTYDCRLFSLFRHCRNCRPRTALDV